MRPKLIIFDVDGLMLDTEARCQQAWQEIGARYHIDDLGQTTFLKCVGRNGKEVEDIVRDDLKEFNVNPVDILNEARIYGRQLLKERIDPKEGIYELLDKLNQLPIQKAVATATNRDLTIERLTRLHLIQFFDYLLCGDEVTKRKPNPEIYNKVLQHFHVNPKEALVLEDSLVGVEAAYHAHIPCIMIPDLVPATQKQKDETIAIVSSLFEVIDYID